MTEEALAILEGLGDAFPDEWCAVAEHPTPNTLTAFVCDGERFAEMAIAPELVRDAAFDAGAYVAAELRLAFHRHEAAA